MFFVTSNKVKFREAKEILRKYKIDIEMYKLKIPEIRSDSLEEIAKEKANYAKKFLKEPFFIEDTGFFINSLNGFPGAYSRWVFDKIGNKGILNLLRDKKDRSAYFKAVIVFSDLKKDYLFEGELKGRIANKLGQGYGYDPIFIPNGHEKTLAEMENFKNTISHRYNVLTAFANWYRDKYKR